VWVVGGRRGVGCFWGVVLKNRQAGGGGGFKDSGKKYRKGFFAIIAKTGMAFYTQPGERKGS